MKSPQLKKVWRFWPGLLGLLTTGVILSWILNPTVVALIRSATPDHREVLSVACSPNNRLLAIARNTSKGTRGQSQSVLADNIHSGDIQLIDFANQCQVAVIDYGFDPYGFTADNQFVWVNVQGSSSNNTESIIELLACDSKRGTNEIRFQRTIPYAIDGGWHTGFFRGLHQLGRNQEFTLLSPDCATLLVPLFQEEKVVFDLIDVATGRVRSKLEMPDIDLRKPISRIVEADFSQDGKILLTQTEEPDEGKCRYRLQWFDAVTGKLLRSILLPGKETALSPASGGDTARGSYSRLIDNNQSRLGPIVFLNQDMVVAKMYNHESLGDEQMLGLRIIRPTDSDIGLTEVLEPHPDPRNWTKRGDPRQYNVSLKGVGAVDVASRSLAAIWHFDLSLPKEGNSSACALPFQHVKVFRLGEGSSISSYRLPLENIDPDGFAETCDELKAILPGPNLLFQKRLFTRNDRLATWKERIRGWFGLNEHLQSWEFYVFNLRTGACDFRLPVSYEIEHALFMPERKQLALFGTDDQGLYIRMYDYPLHKPWLLIWGWALGVAATITLLVEATRRVRRRRKA